MTDQPNYFETVFKKKQKEAQEYQANRVLPGLFSVDASMPREWQQTVTQQQEYMNGIKNGIVRNGNMTITVMTTKDIHIFRVAIAIGVASSLCDL